MWAASAVYAGERLTPRRGLHNSWVIETLVENDVIVVDLFGKIKEGTFAGDNLGTVASVVFIPAHLAQAVVERSELIRKQDEWGQLRIREGKYSSGQVDGNWTEEMKEDFAAWHKTQQ